MDPVMAEKLQTILESKNGEKVLSIFQMAAYFAPKGIRNSVFASVFPNPSQLKDAIQLLQRLSFIELSDDESSFSIPCETRSRLREHLSKAGMEEDVLKRALGLLNETGVEYPHLQSVYISAKIHPSLIEDVCKLPGNIIFGMLRAEKFKEAYEFGTVCIEFLSTNLGEFHRVISELKTFLTFALLVMMKPKDKAMSLLKDIYKKWNQVFGNESYGALLKMITHAFENDRCDTSKCEARVREMIFPGKNASDVSECCDFENWVLYCEILLRLRVIRKSLEILNELIERGKVLFGKEEVSFMNAMHVKALGLIEGLKLREAMDLLKDIFEKRKDKFGPKNLKTICIQIDIGKLLTMINKEYDASIKLFEEVAKSLKQVVGERHELYLVAKENMVEIYRKKLRNMEKAYELSSSLTDILISYYGVFHPKTYNCKFSLGEILLEMEKFNEAQKIFKELLKITKISLAPPEEIWLLQMRICTAEKPDLLGVPSSYHLSSRHGGPEEVHFQINGCSMTPQGHTGRTPDQGFMDTYRSLMVRGADCHVEYTRKKTTSLLLGKDRDEGCKNLLGLFEGMFLDVKKGDTEAVRQKLRGLKSDDVHTVTTTKNEENRTLFQEARKLNHLELAKELQKLTLKDE